MKLGCFVKHKWKQNVMISKSFSTFIQLNALQRLCSFLCLSCWQPLSNVLVVSSDERESDFDKTKLKKGKKSKNAKPIFRSWKAFGLSADSLITAVLLASSRANTNARGPNIDPCSHYTHYNAQLTLTSSQESMEIMIDFFFLLPSCLPEW